MQIKNIVIKENKRLKARFYELIIEDGYISKQAKPGQFLHIKQKDNSLHPLLRRPFSIYNIIGKQIHILYEVIGEGTSILSKQQKGETLSVLGPIGNHFDINTTREALLIGGGIGIAPLLFLAKSLLQEKGIRANLIVGYRTKDDVIGLSYFKELGIEPFIVTNDGSLGEKGYVTDHINIDKSKKVFACGPIPMLKILSNLCLEKKSGLNIECELSIHSVMGCGYGICLGCVVPSKSSYTRVCVDGPVFSALDISL